MGGGSPRVLRLALWAYAPLGAARAAPVGAAGSHGRANLFVVVTDRPHALLQQRWARERVMYDTRNGSAPVHAFIASTRPLHVWYDTALGCSSQPWAAAPANALAAGNVQRGQQRHGVRSRGRHGVEDRGRARILCSHHRGRQPADARRHTRVTGCVRRAERARRSALARGRGATPTILQLFFGRSHPPLDLTAWDRALRDGLYNTRRAGTRQATEINRTVLQAIEGWVESP